MIQDEVEDCLKHFLQKKIKLQIGDKVLKEGRLILFTVKDFIINFTFKNAKNELKKYEIPIPFNCYVKNDTGTLDYRVENIAIKSSSLYVNIMTISSEKKSKLYNTILHIHSN